MFSLNNGPHKIFHPHFWSLLQLSNDFVNLAIKEATVDYLATKLTTVLVGGTKSVDENF